MDPLSITASVIAVLTAARATVKGLRKASDYRKAPQEIESLVSELDALYGVVAKISNYFSANNSVRCDGDLLDSLELTLSKVKGIADCFRLTHCDQKTSASGRYRLSWIFKKSDIVAMRDELKVIRLNLVLQLSLEGTASLGRLERLFATSHAVQEQLAKRVEAALDLTQSPSCSNLALPLNHEDGPFNDRLRLLSHYSTSKPYSRSHAEHLESEDVQNESVNEEQIVNDPLSLTRPLSHRLSDASGDAGRSCEHHAQSLYKSPWILRSIIGEFEVRCTPKTPQCNKRGCQRAASTTVVIEFQPPFNMCRRYVELKMQSSPYEGPQFFLRMPRVVSWSHQLWHFAKGGQSDAVLRLFSKGMASPFDVTESGGNSLLYARNNLEVQRLLLVENADPYKTNQHGRTAAELMWERAYSGKFGEDGPRVVGKMLKDTDCVETSRFSDLHKVVLGITSADLQAEIRDKNTDINVRDSKGKTALRWATTRNDIDTMSTLLSFGADPNIKDNYGNIALDFVQSVEACEMLLNAGANVLNQNTTHGRTPLHYFDTLFSSNPDVKETANIIDLLIGAGIDVNVRDSEGEAPLLRATYEGVTEAVASLLSHSANPNFVSMKTGNTALHIAVKYNYHDIAALLLQYEAKYTFIAKRYSQNLAHLAALHADTRMIKLLNDHKLVELDFGLRDDNGKLPVDHIAERIVFYDEEIGVHDAFHTWSRSISNLKATIAVEGSPPCEVFDLENDQSLPEAEEIWSLPGAYPV